MRQYVRQLLDRQSQLAEEIFMSPLTARAVKKTARRTPDTLEQTAHAAAQPAPGMARAESAPTVRKAVVHERWAVAETPGQSSPLAVDMRAISRCFERDARRF